VTRENSEVLWPILRRWGAHPRVRLYRRNVGRVQVKGRWVQFGIPGQADIGGILAPNGRVLEIECKTLIGRQSPEQKHWQAMIQSFGGLYILARSVADVDAVLIPLIGDP
jgi:hypothetical protein